jgi:hypothetical protein
MVYPSFTSEKSVVDQSWIIRRHRTDQRMIRSGSHSSPAEIGSRSTPDIFQNALLGVGGSDKRGGAGAAG